jgi:hypothetical protein
MNVLALLKQIRVFNNENTKAKVQIITDKLLNDCMRVALTKYTPNYKLAEEMQCQVLH